MLVYHTIPPIAQATPMNFFIVIVSPKKTMPLVTMNTVFRWPTTLYVRGEVAPMKRYVLQAAGAGRRCSGSAAAVVFQ